jgi:hypothetical protein
MIVTFFPIPTINASLNYKMHYKRRFPFIIKTFCPLLVSQLFKKCSNNFFMFRVGIEKFYANIARKVFMQQ